MQVAAARSSQERAEVLARERITAVPLMRDHALDDDPADNGGDRVPAGHVPVSDVVTGRQNSRR